jgi:hypothetical protein
MNKPLIPVIVFLGFTLGRLGSDADAPSAGFCSVGLSIT